MTLAFEPVGDRMCTLGEGPVYDDRRNAVWYCDITEHLILRFAIASGKTETWKMPSDVGSLGLARSGRLVVALRKEVGLFDPASGSFNRLCEIEPEIAQTRLNDGKVGPDGAFWVGTMDDGPQPPQPIGSLYRVTSDGRAEKKVSGLMVSNGLAFSTDGKTMFHSDSRGQWLDRWDLDPKAGAISNRKRIAVLDEATGRPDGGATDVEGYYWSAGISAARLNRFTRDGKIVAFHPVPVGAPTMPCFGGPDLKTLYVTSLRRGRAPELLTKYPLTGTLIAAQGNVAGVRVGRFAD